ncbi:MAG: metal-dependent hydrolase [Peptococcaceae bacterium]|nr:metal-dependent hydrolase [Peptococcaceae bacterium]
MIYSTHLAAGVLAGFCVLGFGSPEPDTWPMLVGIAAAGSLIPDLDHGRSILQSIFERGVGTTSGKIPVAGRVVGYAGRTAVRGINRMFSRIVRHRGIMHSIMAVVVFTVLLKILWPGISPAGVQCFAAGYLSHILIDTLNPQGVPLLWPYRKKFSLPVFNITTGSFFERRVLFPILSALAGYVAFTGPVGTLLS